VAHEGLVAGKQQALEFTKFTDFIPDGDRMAFGHERRGGLDGRLHLEDLASHLCGLNSADQRAAEHEFRLHTTAASLAENCAEFGPAFVGELALGIVRPRTGIFGDSVPEEINAHKLL